MNIYFESIGIKCFDYWYFSCIQRKNEIHLPRHCKSFNMGPEWKNVVNNIVIKKIALTPLNHLKENLLIFLWWFFCKLLFSWFQILKASFNIWASSYFYTHPEIKHLLTCEHLVVFIPIPKCDRPLNVALVCLLSFCQSILFLFLFSNFGSHWPNVLKFLHNIFNYNTQLLMWLLFVLWFQSYAPWLII